jgi:ATP-dependent DNA helicase RecG
VASTTRPAPPPSDPVDLLGMPLGRSGLAAAATLRRAGIRLGFGTVRDLLFHLPRRYEDLREMRRLGDLVWAEEGSVVSARVRVADIHVEPTFRRRVQRTVATLEDETGKISATWFGRRYIERRLAAGDQVVVSGRVKHFGRKLTFDNPEFQRVDDDREVLHAGRIVPVYPLTAGLTAARLRAAIREALDRAGHAYPEYLAEPLRAAERLLPIATALEEAHYPSTFEARDAALRRLAFDELLALQIGMVGRRRQRVVEQAPTLALADEDDVALREAIRLGLGGRTGRDVELTPDQAVAMDGVREDIARPSPMLRLLQGDVGSGKTAVAAYALGAAARGGLQAALLAPTDLLARQHLVTIGDLLAPAGVPVTLLTGSLTADGRRNALAGIASGQAAVVVGTHALLSEGVDFADLGLVVIDEQHRFGVEQRGALEAKAQSARPADDGDTDPAHARTGPVCRPRRVRPPHPAGRAARRPDRDPAARGPRGHVATRPRRGRGRSPGLRRRAAHRGGRRGRRAGGRGRDRARPACGAPRAPPGRPRPRPAQGGRP